MASIRPLQEDAQVRQLPTPYAEGGISPYALGAGAGNNAERAAQIVDAAVKRGKDDGDTVAMIAAMGLAQDAYNAQVLDGKTGYASLRGEQAIAARDDVVKSYDKVLEKIAAGLSTPEQKAAFGKFSLTMQERARNKIEEHSRHETEVFAVTRYEGTQQSYRRVLAQPGVVDNAGERDRYVDELSRVAYAEARRRGEDPQLLVGQAQDRAVRTVLDNLLAGKNPNIVEAAQVLGKHGDRLGDDRAKYQKVLQDASDVREADSKTLDIAKKALQGNGQIDIRAAQRLIDALPAGAMKDEVQKRVDHRVVIFDKAWRDEATELAARLLNTGIDPVTERFSVDNVPASMMAALEAKWPSEAAKYKKASRIADEKKDQQEYLLATEHLFGGDNWQRTARLSLPEFKTQIGLLGPVARVKLQKAFDDQQKLLSLPVDEKVVFDEVKKPLGLGGTKKKKVTDISEENQKVFHDVYESVLEQAKQWRIDHKGTKIGAEDLRKIVAEQIQEVPGTKDRFATGFYNFSATNKRVYQLRSADVERVRQRYRDLGYDEPDAPEIQRILDLERVVKGGR